MLGRLLSKTFRSEVECRFPSDEASREDHSGFTELIRVLEFCGQTLDRVRLEVAGWTTTGILRTGNEDAFEVLHAQESRQDRLRESALLLLADGMGGSQAGEVAAALALRSLRAALSKQAMCAPLAEHAPAEAETFDLEKCQLLLVEALRKANQDVLAAASAHAGRLGMGCTAEVVYLNGRNLVGGHVGDSRLYHLRARNLRQMTRDQTFISHLLELGSLTPEEADKHPRRAELQQAVGGNETLEPQTYHITLEAGDWILVCSDGLSNHLTPEEIREILEMEKIGAEEAARRLVNRANRNGTLDNATALVAKVS